MDSHPPHLRWVDLWEFDFRVYSLDDFFGYQLLANPMGITGRNR